MEVVNVNESRYEQSDNLIIPGNSSESDSSSTLSDSDELEGPSEGENDLKVDLQKTIPECYKTESQTSQPLSITNDEEFQATALCQFMDILNDLDEVLDKSLMACLDGHTKSYDSDEDDLICKLKECITRPDSHEYSEPYSSMDDNQVVCAIRPSAPPLPENEASQSTSIRHNLTSLGRSKSYSNFLDRGGERPDLISNLERSNTTADNLRNSMRRLDPIVLPALSLQEPSEPLTLPVILFLEHHVNMRPTSSPLQLQVTAANLSGDSATGPLIVGRRALLMNRALSLPSPGDSDVTGEWTGRNTVRSARSTTTLSSSSSESLAPIMIANQPPSATEERNEETDEPPFGVWPHRMSSMLACLSCTVGIFNISRFAIFSVHYGASFIVQFFILSFLIGIPLFTLHLCLGQVLEAGPVDMWKISPIFQGVGISLLITQAVLGVYSIMGLSWIFVYFRDSFITSADKYKWMLPYEFYSEVDARNNTYKIEETIPQYFHSEVLKINPGSSSSYFGTIKFQVAFNLAVLWMIVFVALSKGLRSYGKAVYMLIFIPIIGTLILCIKLLTLIPYDSVTNIFSETNWSEFFINSNSWAAASQETFLTWGLLGACVMQLTSHKSSKNKSTVVLQRESAGIVAFTFAMLLLGAFLANTCVQILRNNGYVYIPGSYETVKTSQFLWPMSEPMPGRSSTPVRYMTIYAEFVGVRVVSGAKAISGWQPLQLATELVPAVLASLQPNILSPVWAVIFFFILIMFGIAQQLAIWHCVITGIMAIDPKALRVWETTITFLSCVFGLAMGLFFSTDAGISIINYLDFVWVGCWWQCAIQVTLVVGVFVVRGRPYSGDVVVQALFGGASRLSATLAALLSFTWTLILPVMLCTICVMDFRIGQQRQLYSWKKPIGYWPVWARQLAVCMQQGLLLLLPISAFVQTWRYMSKGPPDILDRVQNLYRPRIGSTETWAAPAAVPPPAPPRDPPPKYTPPPSYSTATGARLLNTFRRSYRTLRRITSSRTEPLTSLANDPASQPPTVSEAVDREPRSYISLESQPPHYSGVFNTPTIEITDETDSRINRPRSNTSRNSLSLTRDFLRRSFVRKSDSAKSVRSSLRRSFKYGGGLTTSHEHLVRDAEPISNTVAMSAMLDSEGSPHSRSIASVI